MMFDAIRFGWLGESRRIELHALLVREVSEWSRDWWLHHSSAAIDVYPLDEWQDADETLAIWQVGAGTLRLVPHRGEAALGNHLAAHAADDASMLAARIGKRALADLASRLARRANASIQIAGGGEGGAHHGWDFGAYMATLSLGSYTLGLSIDRAVSDLLVPPKSFKETALIGRAEAISSAEICLEVCIPLGTASLSQLDNLQVGEVLVGDASLSTPVEVSVVGAQTVAFAKLGERESFRAVTLTHCI